MKTPSIHIDNLVISQDVDVVHPLNFSLSGGTHVLFYADKHHEWTAFLYQALHGDHSTENIQLAVDKQFKIIFLDWLDSLKQSPVTFEYMINYVLKHSAHPLAAQLLSLLNEINWMPYLNMRIDTFNTNMYVCTKLIISIALNPQFICLNTDEIDSLFSFDYIPQLLEFCELCGISLIICHHTSLTLNLKNLELFNLETLKIEPPKPQVDIQTLPNNIQQAWITYHEIKNHINTDEFQATSNELQIKIMNLFEQYRQQLIDYDLQLLDMLPDSDLGSSNDWLNEHSNLTKMLFDETISEADIQSEITKRITSSFEPEEITEPFEIEIDHKTTAQVTPEEADELEIQKPITMTIEPEPEQSTKENDPNEIELESELSTQDFLNQFEPTTSASTVLIPPTDIDKIKKPKQNWKDIFHLKQKK